MGTDDSSLLKGIIDFDYVAKKEREYCLKQLKEYEYFGTPIHPEDLISGIVDPNCIPAYVMEARQNPKIKYVEYFDNYHTIGTFPLYLIYPYDYTNPEIYKRIYPLPDVLQEKVDRFINETWVDIRSTLWNSNQPGTSQKKQLPKSKKQLRKNEKSVKSPEEPGLENTLGIPRIKLSPSLLA